MSIIRRLKERTKERREIKRAFNEYHLYGGFELPPGYKGTIGVKLANPISSEIPRGNPHYQITSTDYEAIAEGREPNVLKKPAILGEVQIRAHKSNAKTRYFVSLVVPRYYSGETREKIRLGSSIGYRNKAEANSVAHEAAVSIGKRIARKSKVSFEDLTEENLEAMRTAEESQKSGGIEAKLSVFILLIIGGIILVAVSLTVTGNAISNLIGTTQGLLGVFLFIVGIFGVVFNLKNK